VKPAYFSSVADENVLANRLRIPVLTIGPVGGGDHTKDEWLRISSMVRVTEVYASLVAQWNSLYATMAATTA
jgi:acetylornithine deacetylase/succinyl-diaminopimelate desuccinylase-like protein